MASTGVSQEKTTGAFYGAKHSAKQINKATTPTRPAQIPSECNGAAALTAREFPAYSIVLRLVAIPFTSLALSER
jgi:hypothetical protein